MIEIQKVRLRNFLSYGDYDTEVNLADLGPCLITGQMEGDSRKSNGTGKSTITNAIAWCLFGRTMHKSRPGDKVINWETGQDCEVQLTLKSGDTITRQRKVDGHNDLIYIKDGVDVTASTNKAQQKILDKEFNLDWELFCGSVFLAQIGQSWMELSDQKRKQALEREFKLDRFKIYSDVAKEQYKDHEAKQEKIQSEITNIENSIKQLRSQCLQMEKSSEEFERNKKKKIEDFKDEIKVLQKKIKDLDIPSIDELKEKWDKIDKVNSSISKLKSSKQEYQSKVREKQSDQKHSQNLIDQWDSLGPVCSKCEQEIPEEHKDKHKKEIQQKIDDAQEKIDELQSEVDNKEKKIKELEDAVKQATPEHTIKEANSIIEHKKSLENSISKLEDKIEETSKDKNHYDKSIKELNDKINKLKEDIKDKDAEIDELDVQVKHYKYIYKAYNTRKKIKSYVLGQYIPYLNQRIAYYLNRLELDLHIEFTDALGIKSSKWDYDFFSGGQLKRVNLAIMLAVFDLHCLMYGRQCNVIVFDEVEGDLDPAGAEIFADIVKTDLSEKVDSALIISQRLDMKDKFPSKIRIEKENDLSKIVEIQK